MGKTFEDVGDENGGCDFGLARGVKKGLKATSQVMHTNRMLILWKIWHLAKTPSIV